MTRRHVGGFLAVILGPLGWCAGLSVLIGGDPMMAIEIGGVAVTILWAAALVRELVLSGQIVKKLSVDAEEIALFGVPCNVTPALGLDALVVGSVRPRIFVGAQLIGTLTDQELEAVVFHEDHHRRNRAPLRAAALGAWLRVLGRSECVRNVILDRIADLETMADADAIRRGSSPRSLARALLKGEISLEPVAFSYVAGQRVERLLDHAAGNQADASAHAPYEWLPIALLAVTAVACHAGL